jgi:hypothetical protein
MYYMLRNGWHGQFLEADLKTPLPKKLSFTSPERVIESTLTASLVQDSLISRDLRGTSWSARSFVPVDELV